LGFSRFFFGGGFF
jgi:dynein light intermediate chain